MENHVVIGIHITDRATNASDVQRLLTQFGCSIKTRIGLHHVDEKLCSPNGLILLEMFGDPAEMDSLRNKLSAIEGVQVQQMVFTHA
ncbi:MAG: hypothetical protein KJ052_05820 [Candidatus Hydrogenedentes bacterium]|nr:hypothetical protein [Candidatus Hydrogenedentota bacterium]